MLNKIEKPMQEVSFLRYQTLLLYDVDLLGCIAMPSRVFPMPDGFLIETENFAFKNFDAMPIRIGCNNHA